MEVLAEHSTDEGGELRSEEPTRGKAKPGTTCSCRALLEIGDVTNSINITATTSR